MPYIVTNSDGSLTVTVPDSVVDTSTYSLALIGRNVSNFGQYFAQNTIRQLENFASTTAPSPNQALIGQLWYDKSEEIFKVFDGNIWKRSTNIVVGNETERPLSGLTGGGAAFFNTTSNKLEIHDGVSFRDASYAGEVSTAYSGSAVDLNPKFYGTRLRSIFLKTELGRTVPVIALTYVNDVVSTGTNIGEQRETIMAILSNETFMLDPEGVTNVNGLEIEYGPELIDQTGAIAAQNNITGRPAGQIQRGWNLRSEYADSNVGIFNQVFITGEGATLGSASNPVPQAFFEDVDIFGNLELDSLNVSGQANFGNDVTIIGDLTLSVGTDGAGGKILAPELEISTVNDTGIVTVRGTSTFDGETTLSGVNTLNGETYINGNLYVNGDDVQSIGTNNDRIESYYGDNATFSNVTINTNLTTDTGSSVDFGGTLDVTGNTTVTKLDISGAATVASGGSFTANGPTYFNSTNTYGNNADIVMGNNADISMTTGNVTMTSGDLTLTNGNIEVTNGDISVGGQGEFGSLVVTGDSSLQGNATVGINFTVDGETTLGGNASVANDLSVSGNASVGGTLDVTGNTTISSGDLTVSSGTIYTDNIADAGNGYVILDVYTIANDDFWVEGHLQANATLIVGGTAGFSDDVTINQANLTLIPNAGTGAGSISAYNADFGGTLGVTGDATLSSDVIIEGNLTVNGTTTTIDTLTLLVEDNIITLNSNVTGTPSTDGGIEIERGTQANKTLVWDESEDKWSIGTETFVAGTFEGNLSGSATQVDITDSNDTPDDNAAYQLLMVDTAGTGKTIYTDNEITYNPSTNRLTAAIFDGTATEALYADLAERYLADQNYPPGTVVKIGGEFEITETVEAGDIEVFGVISTDPAFLMNKSLEGGLPVAMTGRVPVRVRGNVNKGDRLISSGEPGVAMSIGERDYDPRMVIGRALESRVADMVDNQTGMIEAVIGVK